MKYQEALAIRKTLPDEIEQLGVKMEVLIAPSAFEDFQRFTDAFRTGCFVDETAHLFSLDKEFFVAGFWTDGVNVIWKDLTAEKNEL